MVLILATPALAQDAALNQMKSLNQEAVAAFESYAFKKAQGRLSRALDLAAEAGIKRENTLADTYMLLAVANISGSNDLYRGLHYFVKALRINSRINLPKQLATPQLLQMFSTAKKTIKLVGKPPKIKVAEKKKVSAVEAKVRKSGARGLIHNPIDTAKKGYPIPVKTAIGVDIQAHKVFLNYRKAGQVKFSRLPMAKKQGEYRAAIPTEATHGRYVHYFIEALDQRGRLAGSNGSARSPNVIIIEKK